MCKKQFTRIGPGAVEMLLELPQNQAGWLIQNGLRLLAFGTMPKKVPRDCIAAWLSFKREAGDVNRLSALRAIAGRRGGLTTQAQIIATAVATVTRPVCAPCFAGCVAEAPPARRRKKGA